MKTAIWFIFSINRISYLIWEVFYWKLRSTSFHLHYIWNYSYKPLNTRCWWKEMDIKHLFKCLSNLFAAFIGICCLINVIRCNRLTGVISVTVLIGDWWIWFGSMVIRKCTESIESISNTFYACLVYIWHYFLYLLSFLKKLFFRLLRRKYVKYFDHGLLWFILMGVMNVLGAI